MLINIFNNLEICFLLALEKVLTKFLNYGEKKVLEDGLEDLDTTFLEVLAYMLKEIKCKMVKYAEPIMILAKNILALKVRTKIVYFYTVIFAIPK